MLHGLSRRDQTRVRSLAALELAQDLLALLDDALNGLARNAFGPLAHELEHLLETLYLTLGFLQVHGQRALELLGLSGFGHLRQGFQDGALREVGVLELVDEEGLQVFLSHGAGSRCALRTHSTAGDPSASGSLAGSLAGSGAANSHLELATPALSYPDSARPR